jgi:hypothetical protein
MHGPENLATVRKLALNVRTILGRMR